MPQAGTTWKPGRGPSSHTPIGVSWMQTEREEGAGTRGGRQEAGWAAVTPSHMSNSSAGHRSLAAQHRAARGVSVPRNESSGCSDTPESRAAGVQRAETGGTRLGLSSRAERLPGLQGFCDNLQIPVQSLQHLQHLFQRAGFPRGALRPLTNTGRPLPNTHVLENSTVCAGRGARD